MRRACVVFSLLCLFALYPTGASAHVERFAVIVANDLGQADDTPLRYAQTDATRVREVLRDIGGFSPVNTVTLYNEDAATVRDSLISVNERIREVVSRPDTQVLLFVYFSGHADAENLHLGDSKLPVRELTQLARGSAATFRLLVLDACRSGAITRLKGGRVVAPFPIVDDHALPSDGLAFLTASSANEDAQESDELQGSFFTHALVSGLLGAADRDGDGSIALEEAYRYAYQATLRATSRSFAGTQHPAFRYDFHGQGELVLTQPNAHAAERASLHFPEQFDVLLMRDHAQGAVVAELSRRTQPRTLSVRPGAYFVRARGQDVIYEGAIEAPTGGKLVVPVRDMQRIDYAHLVRKGGRSNSLSHGPELGVRVRSSLANAERACVGGFGGYGMDWPHFGMRVRLSACTSGYDNPPLRATTNAYDLELQMHHAWDVAPFTIEIGVEAGGTLFTQRFETSGNAPSRSALAPFVGVGLASSLDLTGGFYAGVDVAAETHFLRMRNQSALPAHTQVDFGARVSMFTGKRF